MYASDYSTALLTPHEKIVELTTQRDQARAELAAAREEARLWENKCHELIAPHYILDPSLRAAKFRDALVFHPVLNKKAVAVIDQARAALDAAKEIKT